MPYRPFPRGGHDIERRFADMDATGVDMHVLSGAPQTWLYGQEAAVGVAAAAIQNDEMARLVKEHPDRFAAIATLPMQAPDKAADELRRAMTKLGLHGAMIGSNVGGKNLDDPSFEPLWAAAAELDAWMMIHPGNVAGADRLKSVLSRQSDRQSARHHHRRRLSDLRRRAGALSEAQFRHGARRRLHSLSGWRAGCMAGRCGRSRRCM